MMFFPNRLVFGAVWCFFGCWLGHFLCDFSGWNKNVFLTKSFVWPNVLLQNLNPVTDVIISIAQVTPCEYTPKLDGLKVYLVQVKILASNFLKGFYKFMIILNYFFLSKHPNHRLFWDIHIEKLKNLQLKLTLHPSIEGRNRIRKIILKNISILSWPPQKSSFTPFLEECQWSSPLGEAIEIAIWIFKRSCQFSLLLPFCIVGQFQMHPGFKSVSVSLNFLGFSDYFIIMVYTPIM